MGKLANKRTLTKFGYKYKRTLPKFRILSILAKCWKLSSKYGNFNYLFLSLEKYMLAITKI
jgi:hypothetical protein